VVWLQPDPRSIKQRLKQLHEIERRQFDADCQCETLVRSGIARDEIAKVAKELKVDLIILATHHRTGVKEAQATSTAERVVRCATCPVLVVHEKEPVLIPQRATARSHYENQAFN
jgi:nucleotide-binding universal stress UspA family protein